ncbi:helix-turn-helix domain-containing protein [Sorangium sp. So ce327]|uniref:helix-turn-helix domain-containing protein n=1 Tax=Sorangium sp. So ce327 TaxID=3133301 RepID=UPI003F5DF0B7
MRAVRSPSEEERAMPGSRELVQLRAELSRYREQKSRGKYPSELRERAEAYAKARSRSGATPTEIATELGVHKMTADRWVADGERADEGALPRAPRAALVIDVAFVGETPLAHRCRPVRAPWARNPGSVDAEGEAVIAVEDRVVASESVVEPIEVVEHDVGGVEARAERIRVARG